MEKVSDAGEESELDEHHSDTHSGERPTASATVGIVELDRLNLGARPIRPFDRSRL